MEKAPPQKLKPKTRAAEKVQPPKLKKNTSHRTSASPSITRQNLFTADTMSAARTPTHGRGDVRDRLRTLKKRAGVVGGVHNRTPPAARPVGERAKRKRHKTQKHKQNDHSKKHPKTRPPQKTQRKKHKSLLKIQTLFRHTRDNPPCFHQGFNVAHGYSPPSSNPFE